MTGEFHRELLRSASNRIIIEAAERLRPMLAWTWRRRAANELVSTCDFHDRIIHAIHRGEEAIRGFESHRLRITSSR